MTLFTIGSNRIDFIDENDRRRVLLALLERLPEVFFGLTRLARHDLGTIKEEEERACLVGDGLRDESLTRARRSVQEHTLGRLHTESLEQLRVPEWQLDHLTDLGHLLAATTDIVVADLLGVVLIVAVDRFTFVEEGRCRCYDTELAGLHVHDLELNWAETTSHKEGIVLLDRTIAVLKVGDEVSLRNIASDSLDRVSEGEHVDLGGVGHVIGHRMDRDGVTDADTKIAPYNLVHKDLHILRLLRLVGQGDANRLLPLFTFEDHSVTLEYLELVHLGLGELDDRVIILRGVLNLKLVRGLLPLEDSRRKVFLHFFNHLIVLFYLILIRINQVFRAISYHI